MITRLMLSNDTYDRPDGQEYTYLFARAEIIHRTNLSWNARAWIDFCAAKGFGKPVKHDEPGNETPYAISMPWTDGI